MMKIFVWIVSVILFLLTVLIFILLIYEKDEHILRIEILNVTDDKAALDIFTEMLRKKQFEIIYAQNMNDESLEFTGIVDRKDKHMRFAKNVAKSLKCNNIFFSPDTTVNIDVTIIIGDDYKKILKRSFFEQKDKNDR